MKLISREISFSNVCLFCSYFTFLKWTCYKITYHLSVKGFPGLHGHLLRPQSYFPNVHLKKTQKIKIFLKHSFWRKFKTLLLHLGLAKYLMKQVAFVQQEHWLQVSLGTFSPKEEEKEEKLVKLCHGYSIKSIILNGCCYFLHELYRSVGWITLN